jgi:hypothetical protein
VLRAIAREDDRLDCRSDPLQSASLAAGDICRHRHIFTSMTRADDTTRTVSFQVSAKDPPRPDADYFEIVEGFFETMRITGLLMAGLAQALQMRSAEYRRDLPRRPSRLRHSRIREPRGAHRGVRLSERCPLSAHEGVDYDRHGQ